MSGEGDGSLVSLHRTEILIIFTATLFVFFIYFFNLLFQPKVSLFQIIRYNKKKKIFVAEIRF